jgi:hypothetical protein
MIIPAVCSLVLLGTYTIWFCVKYSIPESLSQSYYYIPWKPLWTLVLMAAGFLVLPECMDRASNAPTQIIPFVGIFGLLLVAAAPRVRDYERTTHIIGASVAGIFSQLWVILYGKPWTLCVWFIILGLFLIGHIQNRELTFGEVLDKYKIVFWGEVACFFTLYINLLCLK